MGALDLADLIISGQLREDQDQGKFMPEAANDFDHAGRPSPVARRGRRTYGRGACVYFLSDNTHPFQSRSFSGNEHSPQLESSSRQ